MTEIMILNHHNMFHRNINDTHNLSICSIAICLKTKCS